MHFIAEELQTYKACDNSTSNAKSIMKQKNEHEYVRGTESSLLLLRKHHFIAQEKSDALIIAESNVSNDFTS